MKKGSFFGNMNLSCSTVLHLAWIWLGNNPARFMELTAGSHPQTICNLRERLRQLVSDSVEAEDVMIGGDGVIVEIDETKLGKRKYNRGHRVEGVWVVGGVERTPERKVFLVSVPDRKADILTHIITKYVKPGSIIHTDLWKGYCRLSEMEEYEHLTVNHSQGFKDPTTGVHTNTIEGTWNALKMQIKPRNRVKDGSEEHLWEFIWRRRHAADLWGRFIEALRDSHYE